MKLILVYIFILSSLSIYSQNNLIINNISQKQLDLMLKYRDADTSSRNKMFMDSIYIPYKIFWNGYLGDADVVVGWLNKALVRLPEWQVKNRLIKGPKLLRQFYKVAKNMEKITGYKPSGVWYIVYGPAWTDLGSLGDFAMLIDLAHKNNSSNKKIIQMLPHELTHQIMSSVNKHKDTTALASIIGEGFAVWMNEKYWKNNMTLAQNLGYTEEELKQCDKNIDSLKAFFNKYKYSTEKNIINTFRNRSAKIDETLPGAIGYYLGYRIVESYVNKNGSHSWKDFFIKFPRQLYEDSGF